MKSHHELWQSLIKAILEGEDNLVVEIIDRIIKKGIKPEEILIKALIPATNHVAEKFQGYDFFVPDVILASHAIQTALYSLQPYIKKDQGNVKKVLIGTVDGDLHNIGKSLVILFLQLASFEVIDLGVDVPGEAFVEGVQKHKPDILALSVLLTTSMGELVKVIELLKKFRLRKSIKVLIGGGPVTIDFAKSIEADGYAPNAQMAAKVAQNLVLHDAKPFLSKYLME